MQQKFAYIKHQQGKKKKKKKKKKKERKKETNKQTNKRKKELKSNIFREMKENKVTPTLGTKGDS
jgi:hypothetical protein